MFVIDLPLDVHNELQHGEVLDRSVQPRWHPRVPHPVGIALHLVCRISWQYVKRCSLAVKRRKYEIVNVEKQLKHFARIKWYNGKANTIIYMGPEKYLSVTDPLLKSQKRSEGPTASVERLQSSRRQFSKNRNTSTNNLELLHAQLGFKSNFRSWRSNSDWSNKINNSEKLDKFHTLKVYFAVNVLLVWRTFDWRNPFFKYMSDCHYPQTCFKMLPHILLRSLVTLKIYNDVTFSQAE